MLTVVVENDKYSLKIDDKLVSEEFIKNLLHRNGCYLKDWYKENKAELIIKQRQRRNLKAGLPPDTVRPRGRTKIPDELLKVPRKVKKPDVDSTKENPVLPVDDKK